MKQDVATAGLLWLALTAAGEAFFALVDFYPLARSDRGEDIEHAFRYLVFLAVPVMAFVIAVLVYSALRRRSPGRPTEDGPHLEGRGPVPWAWLGITGALTAAIAIYPGVTGIHGIYGRHDEPDLLVQVTGIQWTWLVEYPQYEISGARELVLPVDRKVEFEITSQDVLHSFWVPDFLMKIDAVPGLTTTMSLTPTELGDYQTDPGLRVQCAELCGMAHARMRIPVRIVSAEEFDAWVEEQTRPSTLATSSDATPAPDAQQVTIVARDFAFGIDRISVEENRPVVITFENEDDGIPHNWSLYESEDASRSGSEPIAGSAIADGPLVQKITFDPPPSGSYYFICDVHPNMAGTLVVR